MEESNIHLVDDVDTVTEELNDLSVDNRPSENQTPEIEVENRTLLDSEGEPNLSRPPSATPNEKVLDSDTSHAKVCSLKL